MTRWQPEAFGDAAAMLDLATDARATLPNLDMNHDVEWIAVAHGWPSNDLLILAERDGRGLTGVASFLVSTSPLVYALGPLSLLRLRVRQFKLYQGLTTISPHCGPAIDGCFEALRSAMPAAAVAYLGAVPIGSDLHRRLMDRTGSVRRNFHVLAWGGESQHCRIRWEGSLEKYLASLGKASRRGLQRDSKTLFGDPTLRCEVKRFQSPDEAEAFLRDGIRISDRTYQKRDLGLGISLGGAVERVIRFAASRGAFLGYILYVNDMPASFWYGFLCARTCTIKQTGYDPAWADHQVGGVLFIEFLRDFERIKIAADWLDFMPDITLFKLRTTNDKRPIRHFYLFPRTIVGTTQYLTLRATDWLSRTAGSMIKHGVQSKTTSSG